MSDSELAELRNTTVGFVFQSFQLLARTTAIDVARCRSSTAAYVAEKRARGGVAGRSGSAIGCGIGPRR